VGSIPRRESVTDNLLSKFPRPRLNSVPPQTESVFPTLKLPTWQFSPGLPGWEPGVLVTRRFLWNRGRPRLSWFRHRRYPASGLADCPRQSSL